jgi:hypothetical protein
MKKLFFYGLVSVFLFLINCCTKDTINQITNKQDLRSSGLQFHNGSSHQTYRIKISENYAAIIDISIDSFGVVQYSDSIVSSLVSDKYGVIDLRETQEEMPNYQTFDSLKLTMFSLDINNSTLIGNDFVSGLSIVPPFNVTCICTDSGSDDQCRPVTSHGLRYCDSSSMFCLYCSMIVNWDSSSFGNNGEVSGIIYYF